MSGDSFNEEQKEMIRVWREAIVRASEIDWTEEIRESRLRARVSFYPSEEAPYRKPFTDEEYARMDENTRPKDREIHD